MDATEPGTVPAQGQQQEPTAASATTTSPSPKRPSDLAAELKGLTPSGDEGDGGHLDSSPRAKKQRIEESGSDDDAQSADDGEVSESDEDEEDDDDNSSRHSEASGVPQSSGLSLKVPEKPASTSTPINVKGFNPGISLGVRTSFAARRAGKAAPAESTPLFATAPSRSASPEAGEHSEEDEADEEDETNDGEGEKSSTQASRASPVSGSAAQAKSPAAASSKASSTFNSAGVTWTVPNAAPFSIPKNSALRKPAGWRSILDVWITTFLKENIEHADEVNKQVLVTSLNSYVSATIGKQQKGGKNGKNPVVKAKSAIIKMWAGIDERTLDKIIADSKQDAQRELEEEESSAMSESDAESCAESGQEDGGAFELDADEELRQQQLYYPGAADPSQCCLYCSGVGHKAKQCPQRSCRFCSSSKHTSYGCPTKRRCSRCYALGHSSKSCTEKLALSAEERDPCTFCGAPHIEAECSEIWRSYNPGTVVRRTVKSIPTFCFTCGHQGHYGSECGLPGRGPKITGPTTWSQANRDLYVDPESDAIAIGWANLDSSSATAMPPVFHIRGHAGPRRTHTHFVSSDDSEDDGFIHEPIRDKNNPNSRIPNQQHQGRAGAGSIRISSNISSGGPPRVATQSQRRRDEREFSPPPQPLGGGGFSALSSRNGVNNQRGGNSGNWQPPLPPGPPPPPAPNSMPSGYANLPPRPNTGGSHRSGGGGGGGGSGRNHGPPPSRPRGGAQRSQNRPRGGRGRGGRR